MNKIFSASLLLGLTLSFSSCVNEEDDIFDQSAAQRLNAASELYSGRLMASPNGWAMQLYPTLEDEIPFGNGYLLLMNFNKDHSVKVGMNNLLSGNEYREDVSSWDVITDNGPVLSFSSFNTCLHAFSDPEDLPFTTERGEDETGTGIGGDYEFVIVDAPEDASYMMLKGKKRGTYNLLTPLQDNVDFNQYLNEVNDFKKNIFSVSAPNLSFLKVNEFVYSITGAYSGIMNIFPVDGDSIANSSFNPYLITKRADKFYMRLRDAFEFADGSSVQDFVYNDMQDIFECVDNPQFTISGPNGVEYFDGALTDNKRWQMRLSDSMSDDMHVLIEGLKADMKRNPAKYEFDVDPGKKKYGLYIYKNDTDVLVAVDIKYVSGGKTRQITLSYTCTYAAGSNEMTISNIEPMNSGAENMINTFPKLNELLGKLADAYRINGLTTNFDMSSVKLTSISTAEKWCTFNYIR